MYIHVYISPPQKKNLMEMLMKIIWNSTNATKSELKACPPVTTTHLPASHIVKMVHCSPNNVLIRRLIISNPYLKGKVHLLFGGEVSADHLLILHVHGTAADKNIPFLSSSYLTFNISPQPFGPWIWLFFFLFFEDCRDFSWQL